jgi:hypothetical protein
MALMLQRETQPADTVESTATPRVSLVFALTCAVLVALGIALWPAPIPTASVRVRNISSVPIQDVTIGRGHYGSVDTGATSPYQSWGPVFETSYVSFRVGDQRFTLMPEDHVGEHPLKSGEVTFEINVTGQAPHRDFTVRVVRE